MLKTDAGLSTMKGKTYFLFKFPIGQTKVFHYVEILTPPTRRFIGNFCEMRRSRVFVDSRSWHDIKSIKIGGNITEIPFEMEKRKQNVTNCNFDKVFSH